MMTLSVRALILTNQIVIAYSKHKYSASRTELTQAAGETPALQVSQNHGTVVNEERSDRESSTPSSSGTP